jgi:cobalt-zinc-cadmium efflux system membrane fusion protein
VAARHIDAFGRGRYLFIDRLNQKWISFMYLRGIVNFMSAGLLIGLAIASIANAAQATQTLEITPAARAALGLETAAVQAADRFAGAEASGIIVAPPGRLMSASSPFSGVVVQPLVMPGSLVQAGDPLAVIYSPDFATALGELETLRFAARHKAGRAERAEALRAEGLMSAEDAEVLEHEAVAARLAFEAMRDRLAGVEADPAAPGQFRVAAPGTGVVAHLHSASGESIPAAGPIASVFVGDTFWARAQASERAVDLLALGGAVRVAGWEEQGEIVAIDPEIDSTTRSIEVLVQLPEGGPWRLGRLLDLTFDTAAPAGSVAVPSAALVSLEGEDAVFVEAEGGFQVQPIEVLARSRDTVLVRGPVSAGNAVAVSGLAALKNLALNG